jgi:hypothetical protein
MQPAHTLSIMAPAGLCADATQACDEAVTRYAHTLIESVTAIMMATEAKRRWLASERPRPDEARKMIDLIDAERARAAVLAIRLRRLG